MFAAARDELLFQGAALRPGLAETGGDHDDALHAMRDAIVNGLGNVVEGSGNNGEVNGTWHIAQGGVSLSPQNFGGRRRDQINSAGETSGDELFGCDVSPFVGGARSSDDSNRARMQYLLQTIERSTHSFSLSSSDGGGFCQ